MSSVWGNDRHGFSPGVDSEGNDTVMKFEGYKHSNFKV